MYTYIYIYIYIFIYIYIYIYMYMHIYVYIYRECSQARHAASGSKHRTSLDEFSLTIMPASDERPSVSRQSLCHDKVCAALRVKTQSSMLFFYHRTLSTYLPTFLPIYAYIYTHLRARVHKLHSLTHNIYVHTFSPTHTERGLTHHAFCRITPYGRNCSEKK